MSTEYQLSELQLQVMRVLWMRGEATAAEVHAELQEQRGLAFTTVATVLSRLEKRQLVDHRSEGRQYVYHALVSEKEVRQSMVADLVERVFRGDAAALVNHLITEAEIDAGDLAKVKSLIARAQSNPGEDENG